MKLNISSLESKQAEESDADEVSAGESSDRTEEVKEIKDSIEEDRPLEETKKGSNSGIVEKECLVEFRDWTEEMEAKRKYEILFSDIKDAKRSLDVLKELLCRASGPRGLCRVRTLCACMGEDKT